MCFKDMITGWQEVNEDQFVSNEQPNKREKEGKGGGN